MEEVAQAMTELSLPNIINQIAQNRAVRSITLHPDDWRELCEMGRDDRPLHLPPETEPPNPRQLSAAQLQACKGLINGAAVMTSPGQKRGTYKLGH